MEFNQVEREQMILDPELSGAGSFNRHLSQIPAAFAITAGDRHALVYANPAFRDLLAGIGETSPGAPIMDAFATGDRQHLTSLLDRAYRTGVVSRDRRIGSDAQATIPLACTIWPELNAEGAADHLLIELRPATQGEIAITLQREVAERLLLSAVRVQDAADVAEKSRAGATFLAVESRRLAESLDEDATLGAIAKLSLPSLGEWCIVDTLDDDDTMHRVAVIHPDPALQDLLGKLEGQWVPKPEDAFGLPAALGAPGQPVVTNGVAVAVGDGNDAASWSALRSLLTGQLLTVPLVIRERLVGAVTFVGGRSRDSFSPDEIELAQALASRSAMALDRARTYGAAVEQRMRAEAASDAKNTFLGMMSHELRTPLNAIGGYVDLLDLEIHGPVTEAQHTDLARIRSNQRYLTGLISDLLSLASLGHRLAPDKFVEVGVEDVLLASVALIEPLIAKKQLVYDGVTCDANLHVWGDRERIIQVLVNLLSNAIKFTPPGGHLRVEGSGTDSTARMCVRDTGIGIPSDKLESIFDAFVQVRGDGIGPEAGIGLGLAISRTLAREMRGDLTVESTLGEGSCFTLALPRVGPSLDR